MDLRRANKTNKRKPISSAFCCLYLFIGWVFCYSIRERKLAMMNIELLKKAGIDYEAGLKRFLNDSELYEDVLTAFAADDLLERAQEAFRGGDRQQLLKVVHEAKGSCGNADLTNAYTEASALVTMLRSINCTDEEVAEGFKRFEETYEFVRNGIRAALDAGVFV